MASHLPLHLRLHLRLLLHLKLRPYHVHLRRGESSCTNWTKMAAGRTKVRLCVCVCVCVCVSPLPRHCVFALLIHSHLLTTHTHTHTRVPGTGDAHCTEDDGSVTITVARTPEDSPSSTNESEEDTEDTEDTPLLRVRVRVDENYERQQDSIIMWREPSMDVDCALSFQEARAHLYMHIHVPLSLSLPPSFSHSNPLHPPFPFSHRCRTASPCGRPS